MAGAVINSDEFPTTMNIILEGPWFSKEFNKQSLIHPPLWSRSVVDPSNIIFQTSNGIIATRIREY